MEMSPVWDGIEFRVHLQRLTADIISDNLGKKQLSYLESSSKYKLYLYTQIDLSRIYCAIAR